MYVTLQTVGVAELEFEHLTREKVLRNLFSSSGKEFLNVTMLCYILFLISMESFDIAGYVYNFLIAEVC